MVRVNIAFADIDADVCLVAGRLDWPHRDPFDRLIAVRALQFGLPLVTADCAFDDAPPPGLRHI